MSNYNPPPDEGAPTRPMNPQPTNPQNPYAQQPYQQPPYQQQPYGSYPQAQPPKKGGALKWILIGCAGFLLIGMISVGGFVWYGYNRVKQAGVDPGLMRRNPTLAVAKLATMNNPEVEFVSLDEAKNTITVRDKKSGKVITISGQDLENGKITISEDGVETASIQASGDGKNGSVNIQTPDGNLKMGSGSVTKIPDWLPPYPGVEIEGSYSSQTNNSESLGFNFKTDDSIEEVISFYEGKLKEMGMNITKTNTEQNGQASAAVSAHDSDYKRFITVTASTVNGQTQAIVGVQINNR